MTNGCATWSDKSMKERWKKNPRNGHMPRTWSFLSVLLSFWQWFAIWRAKPSSSSISVHSLSLYLFSVSFSLVAFTISVVNICFHASTCHEVDPRCVVEGSTLTCPYVSNEISFPFVRGSERSFVWRVFHPNEGSFSNRSPRRLRFCGRTMQTEESALSRDRKDPLSISRREDRERQRFSIPRRGK